MCGILGIRSDDPISLYTFQAALDRMRHRGPDDQGLTVLADNQFRSFSLPHSQPDIRREFPSLSTGLKSRLAFGHNRLSIIDLSRGGHQPFLSRDGRYAMVFNGEIYNYKELRSELNLKCDTASDTEVLLETYLKLGPACSERFIGMWAFAIYDRVTDTLFASRDPFGIKPFYFHHSESHFVFASEIKGLLPFIPARPNEATIFNFLVNGIKDYDEHTFFESVRQLEPGHHLYFRSGKLDLQPSAPLRSSTKSTAVSALRPLFRDSMRLHIRSDVPFGVALSGGIDSTVIAGVMATEFADVQCSYFSGVYPGLGKDKATGHRVDESVYIDETVQRFHLKSHRVTPSIDYVRNNVVKMIWHNDQPVRVIGVLLNAAIYQKAASEGVKVLIGGQGADETFAGYSDALPPFLFQLLKNGQLIQFAKEWRAIANGPDSAIGGHFAHHVASLAWSRMPVSQRIRRRHERLLSEGRFPSKWIAQLLPFDEYIVRPDLGGDLDSYSDRSFRLKLRDYLDYEDKMSMMSSVESRVPFLSLPFVRAGLSVRADEKIENGLRKAALRKAFRDLIPESIYNRRDKTGYASPQGQWIEQMGDFTSRLLLGPDIFVARYLQPGVLERLIERSEGFRPQDYMLLWRLLSLEIWHRLFIQGTHRDELMDQLHAVA